MTKLSKTGFMFGNPSFASGAARVLDIMGTFDDYNVSSSPQEADQNALTADWIAVGHDIYRAIEMEMSEDNQKVA
jgi:hypothetical protein